MAFTGKRKCEESRKCCKKPKATKGVDRHRGPCYYTYIPTVCKGAQMMRPFGTDFVDDNILEGIKKLDRLYAKNTEPRFIK